jgi:hypothetical protein
MYFNFLTRISSYSIFPATPSSSSNLPPTRSSFFGALSNFEWESGLKFWVRKRVKIFSRIIYLKTFSQSNYN